MQKQGQTILTGKKMITAYMGRSWRLIQKWIDERHFPARKIDGVWESDMELIIDWRKKEIQRQLKKTGN
jgi:hypothetical protein